MSKKNIKNTEDNSNNAPKRRGRRPKKIVTEVSDDESNEVENQTSGQSVILQMKIDPSKFAKLKYSVKEKSETKKKNESEESEHLSEDMFKNDIPRDNLCGKCIKHEKNILLLKEKIEKYEKSENIIKTNKIHKNNVNMISAINGKKIVNKNDVWCMWDGHPFNNRPFHLPESYHNGTYYVLGYFCSPNCALAHNLYYIKDAKVHTRRSLVIKLYREITGISSNENVDLVEAPLREVLSRFGGDMSIEHFRQASFMLNKEYITYYPPMKPSLPIIEERNIGGTNTEETKYVLCRKTPIKKKNSIMNSMSSGSKTNKKK